MPRTKGSRNKRSLEAAMAFDQAARRIYREHGDDVHPLAVLAELCRPCEESSVRVQAAGKLAGFLFPQLKAIEVTADGTPVTDAGQAGQLELAWSADDVEAA